VHAAKIATPMLFTSIKNHPNKTTATITPAEINDEHNVAHFKPYIINN
jgi:hypothetical protein